MSLHRLDLSTHHNCEMIEITGQVESLLQKESLNEGHVLIYSPHTTAGITINENADPDVKGDMIMELNKIVPFQDGYSHLEGNSAAHIKATLTGLSAMVPVSNGRMILGTWQGIYFCEFDGPRSRKVFVQISGI